MKPSINSGITFHSVCSAFPSPSFFFRAISIAKESVSFFLFSPFIRLDSLVVEDFEFSGKRASYIYIYSQYLLTCRPRWWSSFVSLEDVAGLFLLLLTVVKEGIIGAEMVVSAGDDPLENPFPYLCFIKITWAQVIKIRSLPQRCSAELMIHETKNK